MASDRSKRGGGKETDISSQASGPEGAYQVTVSFTPGKGGIIQNNGADWFGPLNPMNPTAPPEVSGRRFDYPAGYNLIQTPRAYDPIGFPALRSLADGYDLIRLVIETRKDQLTTCMWNIVPRDPKQRIEGEVADRIKKVEAFFLRPDKVHFWDEWLRMVLEDLLVIDAPTLFKQKTKGGDLYALKPIDGATIKRVIDDWGYTPEPPTAAYQQVLKGLPAVDYTTEELLYRPRNIRTNKIYGYSPVEQILMTINIALRRQVFQLQYFTEGNIPEALIGVPETWTPDQIKQFQDWFDGILQGNTAERRRARFVPNAVGKTYIPTKDNELFGKAEEWLARVVCFAFSINAQPFVQMMNRATAEQAGKDADETGMAPLKSWVKGLVDTVILDEFGFEDIQFKWLTDGESDEKKKQEIITGYVSDGLMSINEGRIKMGEDPDPNPIFNKLMMKTSMGYILIENGPIQTNAATEANTESQPGAEKEEPLVAETAQSDAEKLTKAMKPYADLDRPAVKGAEKRVARAVLKALKKMGAAAAKFVSGQLGKVAKADAPDLDDIIDSIELDGFATLFDVFDGEMTDIFADAGAMMLAQIGAPDEEKLVGVVNDQAVKWADARAGELIGKDAAGGALATTTRDMIRQTITTALADGQSAEAIVDLIKNGHAFSEQRAELIAMTEIARANSQGALESYRAAKSAGVDIKKRWFNLEDACDICAANGAQGAIDLEEEFTSGDDAPPGHPECRCALTPVVGEEK